MANRIVPEFMQKIALAVPQSWAMSGFKEIISGSLHLDTLLRIQLHCLDLRAFFLIGGIRGITYRVGIVDFCR